MKVLLAVSDDTLKKNLIKLIEPLDSDLLTLSGFDEDKFKEYTRTSDIIVLHSLKSRENEILYPLDIIDKINGKPYIIIYSGQIDPVKFFMEIKPKNKNIELVLETEGLSEIYKRIKEFYEHRGHIEDVRPDLKEFYDRLYGKEMPFIVAFSPKMKEVLGKSSYFAATRELPVLIMGETGTGKELIARFIHKLSSKGGEFVPVNCADFRGSDLNIVRSELFGHVKGAYTGAIDTRKGAFLRAHKGTLFLDELEELPPQVQAELLRVVQERRIQPLGSEKYIDVDVKIVSATNKNIENLLKEELLREDLYYRIAGGIIELPPLRERGEHDVKLLVEHFLRKYSKESYVGVDREFLESLLTYRWPGNVRELEHLIMGLVSGFEGVILTKNMLPSDKFTSLAKREYIKRFIVDRLREMINSVDISTLTCEDILELKEEFEAILIEPTFLKCGMNFSRVARELKTTKDLRKRKSGEILKRRFLKDSKKNP